VGHFYIAANSAAIIGFLTTLLRKMRQRLLVMWDRLGAHKGRCLKRWVGKQKGRIALARLPPYAPELNPVEGIWAHLKTHEIANLCPLDLAETVEYAPTSLPPGDVIRLSEFPEPFLCKFQKDNMCIPILFV